MEINININKSISISTLLTVCIKTFNRPKCLEKCIESIRKYYTDVLILVADDSGDADKQLNKEIVDKYNDCSKIDIPYDSGLSAGRNCLVKKVLTRYSLIIDDDTIFTDRTKIDKMIIFLENYDYDLIAGISDTRNNYDSKYAFIFNSVDIKDNMTYLYYEYLDTNNIARVIQNDIIKAYDVNMTLNYFVAKTSSLIKSPWYDPMKLGEHEKFFADWYINGLKCAYTTDVIFSEHNYYINDPEYQKMRGRACEYIDKYMKLYMEQYNNIYRDCTIVIKSCMNPEYLYKLLKSIRYFYQSINILIYSYSNYETIRTINKLISRFNNCEVRYIPFSHKESYGRNTIIKYIATRYVLFCDENCMFNKNTNIKFLYDVLETTNIEILSCNINSSGHKKTNKMYEYCDTVTNFFIAKTRTLKHNKWNDDLQLSYCKHCGEYVVTACTDNISVDYNKKIE